MQPLTYQLMMSQNAQKAAFEGAPEQTLKNRETVLRAFLRANHLQVEDLVGDEMRLQFPTALERYVQSLQDEGRKPRNITNCSSALRFWKKQVVEFDTLDALDKGVNTPFVQAIKSLIEGIPVVQVSRQAGIPKDMLMGWLKGKRPRGSNCKYVMRLEGFFAVERHSLVSLSGIRFAGENNEIGASQPRNIYNEVLGKLTKEFYCYRSADDSPFRIQWVDFMRYKTAVIPSLRRTKRGRWRFSPCPLESRGANNWWTYLDGKEVATSRMAWHTISSLLGWLALPCEKGGRGIPEDQLQTMAWLAVPDYLEDFLSWKIARIGGKNRGLIHILGFIASLVRPRFGYLTQKPELQATLPERYQSESWESICDRQFEFTIQLTNAYSHEISPSRNSFDPIRNVIDLPQPMDAIVDMVRRMRAARPIGSPRHENIWARDLVLIKLLSTVALRRRNLASLTWRKDNSGDLYQKQDKSWWVRLHKTKFKNTFGAAGDEPYDCQVHPSAWKDIERYVFIHRTKILRHSTDLLFLTAFKKKANEVHKPWSDLSKRVEELTRRYIPGCYGFGAHAFRHIVATSILKASDGDYKTVAKILHDRVATVEKHYDGLRSNDAARRMGELLEKQFAQM